MEQTAARVGSKVNETRFDRIFNVMVYVLLALMLIVVIYPLYFVLLASVSDPQYVNSGTPLLYPRGFTLMGYSRVFADNRIWIGYANTLLYAGAGTLLAVAVQVMAGYALSRSDLPGRNIFMALFVFTMYFGGGLIPFYLVVKSLNLVNSRLLMVMLGCSSVYNIIIIRSFFVSTLPKELQEAAFIDGCTNQRYFFSIVLPLSKAIIAVIALYALVAQWNSYFNAMIFLTDRSKYPLQLYLRLDMTFRQPWRVVMLLQRDKAWEMDVPEKVCARLSRSHDIYGFSYAERSVFVMLVGMDSQDRQPLVRELEQLAQEPEFADSQPRFSLGIPFEKLTQAPQSYMDALSAGRRMTGEGVAVYEQSEPEEAPFYPEEELQALETALNNQDRNRTAFLYDILMTMVSRNRHVYLYTVTLLSEMIRLYTQALPEEEDGASVCGPVVCGQCVNDVEDMLDCLRKLHLRALQHMTEQDLENSATEMTGIANYISSCEELDTLTVSTVAERYGMNASSLSHRFKKQMGCNISDYIFTCKMNHACALLRSTDQTVAEIAQKVGYSQYTSFVRQFKRQKGLTPTAYRDAWRKEHE